jgi:hypothetical protein
VVSGADTVNRLVTEDQRDVAVDVLEQIVARCRNTVQTDDFDSLDVERVMSRMAATLSLVHMLAHTSLERIAGMDALREE